jgi:site-specific DNA-methyltransferase (adenine-specific)
VSGLRKVYEDDLVTLFHGDHRDGLHLFESDRPAAVVTDPPYGETKFAWDRWPTGWVDDAASIADALWCFGSFRMFHEQAAEFAAWKFSQDIVWEKHNGSSMAADRFRRVHELAVLWYRGDWSAQRHVTPTTPDAVARRVRRQSKPTGHQNPTEKSYYASETNGDRLMRSVQAVRSEHGRASHPTQKPLGIVAPLIEYSVPPGGLVVDLFAGSATTALAARQTGRRCIAFELREDYALAAAERLSQQEFTFPTSSTDAALEPSALR